MAYAGRNDVTRDVCIYVKEHSNMSNAMLRERIKWEFNKEYALSTIQRIREGAYDEKFSLSYRSINNYRYDYDDAIYRKFHTTQDDTISDTARDDTDGTEMKEPKTVENYIIGLVAGGIAIGGLLNGATHNIGSMIIAIILIIIAFNNLF